MQGWLLRAQYIDRWCSTETVLITRKSMRRVHLQFRGNFRGIEVKWVNLLGLVVFHYSPVQHWDLFVKAPFQYPIFTVANHGLRQLQVISKFHLWYQPLEGGVSYII